jgi:hypothetical protein
MPFIAIVILALFALLGCIVFCGENRYAFIISIFVLIGLVGWIIAAGSKEDIEKERITYSVYKSPDGYQYITIKDKPINITKVFGRVFPDNVQVQEIVYETSYLGIDFTANPSENNLVVVLDEERIF